MNVNLLLAPPNETPFGKPETYWTFTRPSVALSENLKGKTNLAPRKIVIAVPSVPSVDVGTVLVNTVSFFAIRFVSFTVGAIESVTLNVFGTAFWVGVYIVYSTPSIVFLLTVPGNTAVGMYLVTFPISFNFVVFGTSVGRSVLGSNSFHLNCIPVG